MQTLLISLFLCSFARQGLGLGSRLRLGLDSGPGQPTLRFRRGRQQAVGLWQPALRMRRNMRVTIVESGVDKERNSEGQGQRTQLWSRSTAGPGVHFLGDAIERAALRTLPLPRHPQSGGEEPSGKDPGEGGLSLIGVCSASSSDCPSVVPCEGDPSISSCQVARLEDTPGAFRAALPDPGNYFEACRENVTGAVGDLLMPGCPLHAGAGGDLSNEGAAARLEGWAGEVFVLRHVYLDALGRVFNRTHSFDAGGCTPLTPLSYGPKTPVLRQLQVINLMASVPEMQDVGRVKDPLLWTEISRRGRERAVPVLNVLALELPLLPLVLDAMPDLGEAILATRNHEFHRRVTEFVVQRNTSLLHRMHAPLPGTLWLVDTLVQPVFQPCNQPSPSLWQHFRKTQLLQHSADAQELQHPATSAKLPQEWLVVVDQALQERVESSDPVVSLLHQYFPPEKITVFNTDNSIRDYAQLFSRAALFMTPSIPALASMVFMPLGASVVELRPGLSSLVEQDKREEDNLATALALACGLKLYRIYCDHAVSLKQSNLQQNQLEAARKLQCNPKTLLHVVDIISVTVYTAPALGKRQWPIVASHGVTSQKASADKGRARKPWAEWTDEDRVRFQAWSDCVSSRGHWVLNPQPRLLAWGVGQNGSPYHPYPMCDVWWERHGGLAHARADEVVKKGGSEAEWNVRQSLKYEWHVAQEQCSAESITGPASTAAAPRAAGTSSQPAVDLAEVAGEPLKTFSRHDFCTHVGRGRTIAVLGDSIQMQLFEALLANMMMGSRAPNCSTTGSGRKSSYLFLPRPQPLEECFDWAPPGPNGEQKPNCLLAALGDAECPGMRVLFIRNNELRLINAPKDQYMQWTRVRALADADVIIVAGGAHLSVTGADFRSAIMPSLYYIRSRFPNIPVVYRSTPPGHKDCTSLPERPLSERQDPASLPYNWAMFDGQNLEGRKMAEELDLVYLDVNPATLLRADGHVGTKGGNFTDCLHYCLPGPIDVWVKLLYNTLLWLLPPPRPDGMCEGAAGPDA